MTRDTKNLFTMYYQIDKVVSFYPESWNLHRHLCRLATCFLKLEMLVATCKPATYFYTLYL
jgi:hypothetical protein